MEEIVTRFWTDLVSRVSGPFSFRFVLQPTMAVLYAFRDGLADAREGRPAYFWAMFAHPERCRAMLAEGRKSLGRVLLLGVVMDTVYQVMVFRWLYVGELVVIVLLLAFVPYLLLRGPVNRIARWVYARKAPAR